MNISKALHRKNEIREILQKRDWEALRKYASVRNFIFRPLQSLLFDNDNLIRWRAIEAIGIVAGIESKRDFYKVRTLIRNQLWMMNDESGGLGWNAPETVGEIIFNVPPLIGEFGPILASFMNEEPFEQGAHWAVARLSRLEPNTFEDNTNEIIDSLGNSNPSIRGYSVLILNNLNWNINTDKLSALIKDNSPVEFYNFDSGDFEDITVGQIAKRYIDNTLLSRKTSI